jgi:hypothetical protein
MKFLIELKYMFIIDVIDVLWFCDMQMLTVFPTFRCYMLPACVRVYNTLRNS